MHPSTAQLEAIKELNTRKSKFVLLVKWRYPFFTRLENLRKPEDCALIGIFAEEIREKLFSGFERHFDLVVWYHADYTSAEAAYSDSGSIEVPAIGEIVRQIVSVVSSEKIRLLECEETMIDVLCRVRAHFSIPGAKPGQLDHLRDKGLLKRTCRERGIPTSRFKIMDFREERKPINELVLEVEQEIGEYPMFRKPISGFGGGGAGTIHDRRELEEWLREMAGRNETYLVEECIHAREFWATVVLLQDGSWRPITNLHCGDKTVHEALAKGEPIPFISQKFEDCEDEFPGLSEFVDLVIRRLEPPAPHVFCVQGFQLEPRTNRYLFTECGYRLNGARGCGLSYKSGGISQETALLSAYMNPRYRAEVDPTRTCFAVWYPAREGVLKSHDISGYRFKSEVRVEWLAPVGARLQKASTFNHFILAIEMEHEERARVEEDLRYFMHVWRPQIE